MNQLYVYVEYLTNKPFATKQLYFIPHKTAHNRFVKHLHLHIDLDLDYEERAVLDLHPVKTLGSLFRIHFIFFSLQTQVTDHS